MAQTPPRPSLAEHLRLAAKVNDIAWNLERLYERFGPVAIAAAATNALTAPPMTTPHRRAFALREYLALARPTIRCLPRAC